FAGEVKDARAAEGQTRHVDLMAGLATAEPREARGVAAENEIRASFLDFLFELLAVQVLGNRQGYRLDAPGDVGGGDGFAFHVFPRLAHRGLDTVRQREAIGASAIVVFAGSNVSAG